MRGADGNAEASWVLILGTHWRKIRRQVLHEAEGSAKWCHTASTPWLLPVPSLGRRIQGNLAA